ncbi:unnamed protein product [Bursaphelenchus xylophilus]|nr:unnamed protein product [Bursaphelenchus xylophilus]CAG9117275.1 unnamed protein product [Bursaphelenchus xylophilus]
MLSSFAEAVVVVLLVIPYISSGFHSECDHRRLQETISDTNQTYYVYVLTQDCQLVFARADQLNELQRYLEVHRDLNYCLPSNVQLHIRDVYNNGKVGFQLIFKRGQHQICLLPVDFPAENAMAGYSVFSYSLLNSMTFATCSYMNNSSFVLEPDLSFMDSTFSDVMYFVDPQSAGAFWSVRQFRITYQGYLQAMEPFVIKNFAEESGFSSRMAGEFLMDLDSERSKLYAVHKRDKDLSSTCSYDLLFRPHRAKVHRRHLIRHHQHAHLQRINSFSSDVNISLYTEFEPRGDNKNRSRVFLIDRRKKMTATCLLHLPYQASIGIISKDVLNYLNNVKLPKFSERARHRNKSTKLKPLPKTETKPSDRFQVPTTLPVHHRLTSTTRRPVTITTKGPPISIYPHKFNVDKPKTFVPTSTESSGTDSKELGGAEEDSGASKVEKEESEGSGEHVLEKQPQQTGDKDSGCNLQINLVVLITAFLLHTLS